LGPRFAAHLVGDGVHQHFRVVAARQVVVRHCEQFGLELVEVGELAVKRDGEPLPLALVIALERLGERLRFRAGGGITDVADGRPTLVIGHDFGVLRALAGAKRFGNGADGAIRVEELPADGVVSAKPRGELAAVLQIEQQPRHKSRRGFGRDFLKQRRCGGARKVINGRDSTLMLQQFHVNHLGEGRENGPAMSSFDFHGDCRYFAPPHKVRPRCRTGREFSGWGLECRSGVASTDLVKLIPRRASGFHDQPAYLQLGANDFGGNGFRFAMQFGGEG